MVIYSVVRKIYLFFYDNPHPSDPNILLGRSVLMGVMSNPVRGFSLAIINKKIPG